LKPRFQQVVFTDSQLLLFQHSYADGRVAGSRVADAQLSWWPGLLQQPPI